MCGSCNLHSLLSVQLHPGTYIYITNRFSGWSSLEPMWHQVEELGADLLSISADHPEGINLIGDLKTSIVCYLYCISFNFLDS